MARAKNWTLRIYFADARTIKRVSQHVSRKAAFAALDRYEARYGRHCNAIDRSVTGPIDALSREES